MAKLFVHIYVETGLGERPIEYQQIRNELLQLPVEIDLARENIDEMIDHALRSVAAQTRQLEQTARAENRR